MRKAQQDLDWKAGAVVFVQVSARQVKSKIHAFFNHGNVRDGKRKKEKERERVQERERVCVSACAWISGRVVEEKGIDKSKSTHVNTIFIMLYIHRSYGVVELCLTI